MSQISVNAYLAHSSIWKLNYSKECEKESDLLNLIQKGQLVSISADKIVLEGLGEDDLVVRKHHDWLSSTQFVSLHICLGNIFKHFHRYYFSSAGNSTKTIHKKPEEDGGTASLL